jgi:hypothetical protein
MHDAGRVSLCDRFYRLQHVIDRIRQRQRSALAELFGQVVSEQKLHHEVWSARFQIAYVEYASGMFAPNFRESARFTSKTFGSLRALSATWMQKLYGNASIELSVPSGNHDTHAARSEDLLDAVLTRKDLTDGDRHFH